MLTKIEVFKLFKTHIKDLPITAREPISQLISKFEESSDDHYISDQMTLWVRNKDEAWWVEFAHLHYRYKFREGSIGWALSKYTRQGETKIVYNRK